MRSLERALRDEKGAVMIMVAIAIVMIFGFAVLAIDLSLIQLAKTQLQNAADAAALAGAAVLCKAGPDSATAEAIRIAGLNVAVQDVQQPVIIDGSDIQTDSNKIMVRTHRTKAKGDPVTLYFMKVLGEENKGEMEAKASAICGYHCLVPFCPPDKWDDADNDGVYDAGEFYDPITTGYMAPDDIGDTVRLHLGKEGDAPKMGWYYPVRFPGYSGADDYRTWICDCLDASVMINIGDQLQMEPGAMVGPTKDGLDCIITKDPLAYWDTLTNTVVSSVEPISPRVVKVPAFDPRLGVQNCGPGVDCVTVVKIMVIFIEGYGKDGPDLWVFGRFMDVDDTPPGFLYTARLVE
jgi:hypothetical protein